MMTSIELTTGRPSNIHITGWCTGPAA